MDISCILVYLHVSASTENIKLHMGPGIIVLLVTPLLVLLAYCTGSSGMLIKHYLNDMHCIVPVQCK